MNLLSNAIKFTPEGGRIEVGAVRKDGFVEISVRDTGVGIAPEDQDAVFEEFRQVGTADKKAEGTGLGLTCAEFCRAARRSDIGDERGGCGFDVYVQPPSEKLIRGHQRTRRGQAPILRRDAARRPMTTSGRRATKTTPWL